MQKGIFRELVWIKVNGGSMNPNSAVQRVDIDAYMPAAINWAVSAGRNINIAQEGNRDYPSMFYGSFSNRTIDRTERVPFITLPKGYVPLPSNEGIRSIVDNCGNTYAPLSDSDRRMIKSYVPLLPDLKAYYPIGSKIELYGINPLIEKLTGEIIVRAEDLDDEDELPIQAGIEKDAIQICFEFVVGQRQLPAQKNAVNTDVNTV